MFREEKEPKPKLFGPDIFGWGEGLPREWVGAKKFGMSLETREIKLFGGMSRDFAGISRRLSGPLNRLNAILSLLHPLDRYRTPSAIGSAIGRPLSRPISHPNTGGSPQPPRSKPLGGLNRRIVEL